MSSARSNVTAGGLGCWAHSEFPDTRTPFAHLCLPPNPYLVRELVDPQKNGLWWCADFHRVLDHSHVHVDDPAEAAAT